tara:strand:- start:9376 stop:10245 length:870 start_codon:yes stop_codon:yes gene_type:complete
MDRINFNHLFYFYMVAKEGSIKSAAEKLHVSQPTISDQIRLLEDFLKSPLFERKARSLLLTREGKIAMDYAEDIFSLSNEMTSRLRNKIDLPKSSIDIGTAPYITQFFLGDLLSPIFQQDQIAIHLHESEQHILMSELETNELDIMISDKKEGITKSMQAFRISTCSSFIVTHKQNKKLAQNIPKSLNALSFINYSTPSTLKEEIAFYFSKHGLAPKLLGEFDSIDLFAHLCLKKRAFVIAPSPAKDALLKKSKDLICLGELEEIQSTLWLIMKKHYQGLGRKLLNSSS